MFKKEKIQKRLILVMVFILSVSISILVNCKEVIKAESNKGVKAGFYLLDEAESETYSANNIDDTVSVKQFGAKGDGVTDDTKAINQAINSEATCIYFPKGKYKITDKINVNKSNKMLLGEDKKSVLITDNDYRKGKKEQCDAVLNIVAVKNVYISGIEIKACETKKVGYVIQFSIRYSSNIKISDCNFIIPETVLSEEAKKIKDKAAYFNGDAFTEWHNVKIEKCKFVNLSDTNVGGLMEFRDIYKKGCDKAIFQNNVCIYNGHDEMISVVSSTTSVVKNVKILNNRMQVLKNKESVNRTMCFTVSYDDNYVVDHIVFEGNKIDGVADYAFMTFGNASNVVIRKNQINFQPITNELQPVMFRCTVPTEKSNIVIEDNKINVSCQDNLTIGGIASGAVTMKNNDITVNTAITDAAFGTKTKSIYNSIVLNGSVKRLGSKIITFTENNVEINGKLTNMFEFYSHTFQTNVTIERNMINYKVKNGKGETFFMLNGTNTNGYCLSFIGNRIKTHVKDRTKKNLCFVSKDSVICKIDCTDSSLGNFSKIIDYTGKVKNNIIF